MVTNFRDLQVWQKSMQLVTSVYRITDSFPKSEVYGLTAQMRRAAVSVPSNVAEGHSRSSTRDFRQFLYIARGSNSELQTQLEIGKRLGFLDVQECESLLRQSVELGKMLNGLITRLGERMLTTNR